MGSIDSSFPWLDTFRESGSDLSEKAQTYDNEAFGLSEFQEPEPSLETSILPTRLDPATNHHSSSSRPHTSQSDTVLGGGFGSYARSHHTGFGGLPASDGFFMGRKPTLQTFQTPSWDFSNASNVGDTGNDNFDMVDTPAASTSGTTSTPAQSSMDSSPPFPPMLMPNPQRGNRKRPRDSTITSPQDRTRVSKSMRATPSPAATRSGSPGSLGDTEFFDMSKYFGPDAGKDLRDMQEWENQVKEEAEARKKQEQRDWELAQQLQDDLNSVSDRFSSPHAWHTGASYRAGGNPLRSYLDASGNIQRAPSVSSKTGYERSTGDLTRANSSSHRKASLYGSEKTASRSAESYATAGPSSPTPTNYPKSSWAADNGSLFKAESSGARGFWPATPRNQDNNGFIDLQDDSDSDVQIIEPDAFISHKRTPNPGFKKEPPTNGGINWAQNTNDFDNLGDVPIMDLTGSSPVQKRETFNMAGSWSPLGPSSSGCGVQGTGGTGVYGYELNGNLPTPSPFDPIRRGFSNAAAAAYNMVDSALGGISNNRSLSAYGQTAGQIATLLPSGLVQQPYSRPGSSNNPFELYVSLPSMGENGHGSDSVFEHMNPTNTTEDLKELMNNIRPDEDLGADDRTGSPEDMADGAALYPHQKLGLTWMVKMEEGSNKGGILADDMGLGKTIQAIALMVSRRSDNPMKKTTLVVAPVALLRQWESEIKIKVRPDKRLSTYIYHGKGKTTTWDKLRHHDVVLTTYGTLASELKRKEKIEGMKKANPNWRPTSSSDQLPVLGDECRFYRVILDEAQNVKNKNTKSARAVHQIQAYTRFCMTGTPMMNHVNELYSLIHFLRIRPYCEWERFNLDFARPLKTNSDYLTSRAMQKFRALLKAILLRRTKKSTINGEPIITLGPRTTEVCHAEFDEDQRGYYLATEKGYQIQFNKYLKAGSVNKNYTNVLVLLLRLRQLCCHPHLIQDFDGEGYTDANPDELLKIAREEFAQDVIDRIIERGIGECPICMDAANNARIFTPCGHSTCSECFARISDPTQVVDDEGDGRSFKCMECRGRVEPTKVTDYNSFKKVHMPESLAAAGIDQSNEDLDSSSTSDSDSDSGSDVDSEGESEGSIADFVVADDVIEDASDVEDDANALSEEALATPRASRSNGKGKFRAITSNDSTDEERSMRGQQTGARSLTDSKLNKGKRSKSKGKDKGKGKGKQKTKGLKKTLAELKKESRRNEKARHRYLKRLRKDWISSAKIDKCLEILGRILEKKDNEKTIVFSQFTTLLDLLEVPMSERGWTYKRYDGSMSANARNDAVLDFSSRKNCRVMLVSLKAGNSGLNLTCANNVILFDPFWNPYIEEQAIDRAHRIGQRRDVFVHRILVPDTVEDRIIALQERKRELIEGALDETASKSIGRLGVRELAFLFGVSAQ